MKKALRVFLVTGVVWLVTAGAALAFLPPVPEGFVGVGDISVGEVAVLQDVDGTMILVQTLPTFFKWVRVDWRDSLGDGAVEWLWFDGQGGGGFVDTTRRVFVRCYPASCLAGEVALYVHSGWVRIQ